MKSRTRKTTSGKRRFEIDPLVRRWLDAEDPEDDDDVEACFERWYDCKDCGQEVVEVGRNVMVDECVFRTRFQCVPEICSPGPGQGKWRCCCADIFVPLTPYERKRLAGSRDDLARYMARNEPRLIRAVHKNNGRVPTFWLDGDGDALSQPNDRCVFSRWDKKGRLRCHLYGFARQQGMETSDIQPFTCRLFPLLVIQMDGGKILITVLNRENYRAWDTLPPWRFPCLNNPDLPLLVKSMAGTLDWVFGEGFSRELQQEGKRRGLLP